MALLIVKWKQKASGDSSLHSWNSHFTALHHSQLQPLEPLLLMSLLWVKLALGHQPPPVNWSSAENELVFQNEGWQGIIIAKLSQTACIYSFCNSFFFFLLVITLMMMILTHLLVPKLKHPFQENVTLCWIRTSKWSSKGSTATIFSIVFENGSQEGFQNTDPGTSLVVQGLGILPRQGTGVRSVL